jgi:hypothetical protein
MPVVETKQHQVAWTLLWLLRSSGGSSGSKLLLVRSAGRAVPAIRSVADQMPVAIQVTATGMV